MRQGAERHPAQDPVGFVADGGEMGARTRALDWSKTRLGPMADWPQSLKTAAGIMLGSRYAMFIWWGRELIHFYNDAYIPVLGARHPAALGRPAQEVWSDLWPILGPQAQVVLDEGRATWNEERLLVTARDGWVEETYFTFSYSPIRNDDGAVGGLFCALTDDTQRVLAQRRLRTVRALAERAGQAKTAQAACQAAAATLSQNPHDLPFVLLYVLDAAGGEARLAGWTGLAPGTAASPAMLDLAGADAPWPFRQVIEARRPVQVDGLSGTLGPLPGGAWPESPERAVVLPMGEPGQARLAGFVVAGLSPRLAFTEAYQGYLDLVARHIADAVVNARAYEAERRQSAAPGKPDRVDPIDPAPLPYLPAEQDGALRPRVLVADDDTDMRQTLVRLLAGRYDVETVPDGEAALARVRERPPSLVIAAVTMPRLDGLGLLRALRSGPGTRELPIILLSERAAEEGGFEGMASMADDYLLVPFSARELLTRVGAHLQMARLRREADEAVRESEGRLRAFVDNAPAVMGVVELAPDDADVLHVLDNAATERYFGLPPGGTVGRWAHRDLGAGAGTIAEWARAYRQAQRTGRPVRFAYGYRPPAEDASEELRWLDVSVSYMGPGDAGRERFCYTAIDDTDRRRAEEALREGEERLRLAKNAAALGIYDHDLRRGSIRWDRRVRELWGVGLDDPVTYETFVAGLHPDDRSLTQARIDRALDPAGDGTYCAEYRVVSRADGLVRCIADTGQVSFADGRAMRLVGTVQDVTVQKRAEAALRESERHFRTLADTAPAMLWVSEPDGACSYLSRGWLEYTGQTEDRALGFGWLAAVHPEDREAVDGRFAQANADHAAFALEYRVRRGDGIYRWAIDAGRPRFDTNGTFLGYIGSVIDIHDRKQTEQALHEADRRKDEFLATLAHELRNPLAPLRNGLAILRLAGQDPQKSDRALGMMERQLEQMVRLIDDLLDVSRISRGKIELRRARVALAPIVHSAIETTRPLMAARGHRLDVHIPPQTIPVDADTIRIAQVFGNLLNNAAKYTDPGGHIALTVRRDTEWVSVSVRDDGIGIQPSMLSRIFDLFTQDGSPGRVQSGLGIGLHIVQRLAKMHGGSVEARSEGRGRGSEFVVHLPVAPALDEEAQSERDPDRREGHSGRRRILIVDDNQDAADSLAAMLSMMGNDTQAAYDGLTALDMAPAFRPDVILLDIGMPRLNGYETAERIRQQPWGRDVVIVALTGWGQEEDRRRSAAAGFDHHLVKPVDLAALGELLSKKGSEHFMQKRRTK